MQDVWKDSESGNLRGEKGMKFKCPTCGNKLSLYVSEITGYVQWICECNNTYAPDGKFTPTGYCISLSIFARRIDIDGDQE